MHVFKATVERVNRRIPSLIGRQYRVDLKIDDVGYMPDVVTYAEFPISLLVLGEFAHSPVQVVIRGSGQHRDGWILPLENQGAGVTSSLLGRCLSLVNHSGDETLKALGTCPKIGEIPQAPDAPIAFDPRVE